MIQAAAVVNAVDYHTDADYEYYQPHLEIICKIITE